MDFDRYVTDSYERAIEHSIQEDIDAVLFRKIAGGEENEKTFKSQDIEFIKSLTKRFMSRA